MTTATYVLEVDWNNDGDYSDSYEDITADLVEVECERGRDYASQVTGRASAGRLTALLRNASGKYASYNSGSPIYGNILPGRPVRLRTTSPSSVTLWTGYLDSVNPVVSAGRLPQARMTAVGPLSRLVGVLIDTAIQSSITTGAAIGQCLTSAQWSVSARNIDTGGVTLPKWWAGREDCLNAIRKLEDTDRGFFYEDADGSLNFEAYGHRGLHSPHTVSQATFSDAVGAARRYAAIAQEDMLRDIFNYVSVTYLGIANGALGVVWQCPGLPFTVPAGQTVTVWARSSQALASWAGAPARPTDMWSTPSNATNVTIGVQYASRAQFNFNNPSGVDEQVSTLQVRGTPITTTNSAEVTSEDTTSQGKYGFRPYRAPSTWLQTLADAQTYASRIIAAYKDPRPVLTMSIRANRDSTHMTEALTRKISDRITVVATGTQTQLGINGDFFIENIRHQISQMGGVHVTTFALSPV